MTIKADKICSPRLWDDPYKSACSRPVQDHHDWYVVGSLQNSCDGSGPWIGVRLVDAGGNFIQGGWFLVECAE